MKKSVVGFLVFVIIISLFFTFIPTGLSQPENVEVLSYNWFIIDIGYVVVAGEVQNVGPNYIDNITLGGVIYTKDGEDQAVSYTRVYSDQILPQQKAPFLIWYYAEHTNTGDFSWLAIGIDHEIFEVCPSIEYFYFLNKYVFYYHLFYLFYYSFPYIEKTKSSVKFTEKERALYKIFLPVMESMFNIQDQRITKKLIFKYYTYNPDELEIIYNKLLLDNVRDIEKKMFNYFLIRSGKH